MYVIKSTEGYYKIDESCGWPATNYPKSNCSHFNTKEEAIAYAERTFGKPYTIEKEIR